MGLDIGLGIIIGGGILIGIINGAIREVFALLGVVAGIFAASRLYARLALILHIENVKVLSFIIVFAVVALLIYLIGFVAYQLLHFLKLGFLDRFLGVVLGAVKGSLIAGILCLFISLFPAGKQVVSESKIAPFVLKELCLIKGLLPKQIKEKLKWPSRRESKIKISPDELGTKLAIIPHFFFLC